MYERLEPEQSLAVLIDVQEKLFPHIHDFMELENELMRLLEGLQIFSVPIVVTQQYTAGLGPTLPALLENLSIQRQIEKLSFSCWGEAEFQACLAEFQPRTLILAGIESHICVQQTALDLLQAGFQVVIPVDAVGSRRLLDHQLAQQRLLQAGALLTTTESLLFELCARAGTDAFKALHRILR